MINTRSGLALFLCLACGLADSAEFEVLDSYRTLEQDILVNFYEDEETVQQYDQDDDDKRITVAEVKSEAFDAAVGFNFQRLAVQQSDLNIIKQIIIAAANDAGDLLPLRRLFGSDSLKPIQDHLNQLYPDLCPISTNLCFDLNANQLSELQKAHLYELFNLYSNLSSTEQPSGINVLGPAGKSYLDDIGFNITDFLARRFNELARERGLCVLAKSQGGTEMPAPYALEIESNADACLAEVREQTIWVKSLNLLPNDAAADKRALEEIDQRTIDELVEKKRSEFMAPAGLPAELVDPIEIIQLAKIIGQLFDDSVGGRLLTSNISSSLGLQLEKLDAQLRNIRRPLGISFYELETIADQLGKYIQGKGYFLSNVYVPKQNFEGAIGEIELRAAFGILGEVCIEDVCVKSEKNCSAAIDACLDIGNQEGGVKSTEVILKPFRAYLDLATTTKIYDAYYRINDLPGVTITSGLFERGVEPGETKLQLRVEEESFDFNLVADNLGSELTGEQRFLGQADWFSPLGLGDKLSGTVLQSSSPANSTYGGISYSLPIFNISHLLTASWSSQAYETLDARSRPQVSIAGDVIETSIGYDYKWRRSQELNLQTGLQLFTKESDVQVTLPEQNNKSLGTQQVEVEGALLRTNGNYLQANLNSIITWDASVMYGQPKGVIDSSLDNDYTRLALNSEIMTLFSISNPFRKQGSQNVDCSDGSRDRESNPCITNRVSFRLIGSYSEDILPSFEQTPLGGPYGVRAFNISDFSADSLLLARSQWEVQLLNDRDKNLWLGFFFEGGYGEANGSSGEPKSTAYLGGYGLSVNFSWSEQFSLETSISFPAFDDASADFEGVFSNDSSRLLFNLRYSL